MNVNRNSTLFLPVCLAAGGFVVSGALFGALSITPSGPDPAANALVQEIVPSQDEEFAARFEMPPARSFMEIVTRPIFASNRRPTAEEELTIETVASELELRLVGVIVASGSPIAIVAPRGSNAFARLTVGDRFQGWTVSQIEPHRVTFRRDNAVERLELSYDLPPSKRPRSNQAQAKEKKTEEKVQD